MWRFLRNQRLILCLYYFQGTHILGTSRGGPCVSVASCTNFPENQLNPLNCYLFCGCVCVEPLCEDDEVCDHLSAAVNLVLVLG